MSTAISIAIYTALSLIGAGWLLFVARVIRELLQTPKEGQ